MLAVVLVACSTPAAPTEVAAPTQAPAEPVVVTVVVEATQPPAQAPAATAVVDANAPIKLDEALGKGVFTNMTMTDDNLTLRCAPRDITFTVTPLNSAIKDVLFWYRVMDAERLYPKDYKNFGEMTPNGDGSYTLVFKGEDVHPDMRIDGGQLDFQFVGLAKDGNVVDRSQPIESLVTYTFDCP
jgi:hypothetical protein